MTIYGLDLSHWQGKMTPQIAQKLCDAGYEFFYVKFSQGSGYKDPEADNTTTILKQFNRKVGAYHFVTTANGIDQYNWFIKCMGTHQFDLTPALDCESYYGTTALRVSSLEQEVLPIIEHRYGKVPLSSKIRGALAATWPTESTTDVIAMRLMGFQGFPVPAIYTSPYAAQTIFKSTKMAQYLLWLANWGVNVPYYGNTVWKNEPLYIWQDGLVDAKQYGITGSSNVDHDIWMTKIPFPDITPPPPPPPPPPQDTVSASLTVNVNGITYTGKTDLYREE